MDIQSRILIMPEKEKTYTLCCKYSYRLQAVVLLSVIRSDFHGCANHELPPDLRHCPRAGSLFFQLVLHTQILLQG